MKMRRVKLRVNHSQLLLLSREETSGNFQKEGSLRVGRQERDLSERFCRLRGNLLFILKKQGGKLEEVLLLERCEVMKLPDDDRRLAVVFVSSDPAVFLESSSSAECASWLAVLRDANTEAMRRRIASLRTLINTHTSQHTHIAAHCSGGDENIEDAAGAGGVESAAKVSPLHLRVECRGVVAVAASRVKVQVCVIDTHTHTVRKHCCCKMVEGLDESVFLTSVCFRGDYPLYHHSRIKVNVYHEEEPTTHATRSFLGFTSFSIRDLFRSKEPHISLSLRTIDGVNEVGEVKVSRLQMEGETPPEHECPALCDSLHGSVHDKENSPMMRAVLCAQVCKVYRFQTEDQRWLLVREQMSETPLSFSLPKQLLSALINSHTSRVQEVKELGDLSPHWDGLRHDVINHCSHLIGCYQETLAELDKLSASSCFKSSGSKSNKHLQFVPTNLHSQRMEVTDPDSTGVWYEVITFGAPADHHQAFKHGGLKRLLSKHTNHRDSSVSYSQDESSRARELLASVAELQPLVFGLAEELLSVSLELSTARLQQVLDGLSRQTEQFVHALKDDLVKSALLTIHSQFSPSSHVHSNGLFCDFTPANQEGQTLPGQQDNGRRDAEYDEEEWDRAWANVAMSLNCIIAMGDRLQGREERPQAVTSSEQQEATGDTNSQNASSSSSSAYSWQEQLLPLVVTLRDCVREAVGKARVAMTFVVLQGAVATTVAQGPAHIVQRRHAVFSQALSAVVCGFMLKLYGGLEDPDFLLQLHSVGLLVQFEGLLSTYGDEVGMLGDMEVGVADLSAVAFTVTEAKTEEPNDLLPTLSGAWGSLVVEVPLPSETFGSLPQEVKDGGLIRVHPVLFNIGINQQQSLAERFGDSSLQERVNQQSCERLKAYCNSLRDALPHLAGIQSLSDLLFSLDRSVETKKRKNVEVLWTAASVCRKVNGVRLTSCKSAKDRTSMSVTLEQCVLLRERHSLSQQHFSTALDCMRRDGCRMENVQKNIGSRKFAFSGVQLLTFPKLYRPPDGSFG